MIRAASLNDGLTRSASFFDPTKNWTRAGYVRFDADSGPVDFYTVWQMKNPAAGASYIGLFGYQDPAFGLALEVFKTGSIIGYIHANVSPATLLAYAVRYSAATRTFDLLVSAAVVGSVVADASAMPAFVTDYFLSNQNGSIGGLNGGLDRIWRAALTTDELHAEAASPIAVRRFNLLSDTPLRDSASLADRTIHARNWTAVGTVASVTDPTFAPLGQAACWSGPYDINVQEIGLIHSDVQP